MPRRWGWWSRTCRGRGAYTWAFEDTCAWLAAHTALSVLTVLLRIAWRTVAAIVTRVVADGRDTNDLLAGLSRIGINEIAYRKRHRYLTRVVDHTTGRLVWAGEGLNQALAGSSTSSAPSGRSCSPTSAATARNGSTPCACTRARTLICLDGFHVVAP